MNLLIVFLPLIAFLMLGFFGRYLGTKGAVRVTIMSISLSFFFSLGALYNVFILKNVISFVAFEWFSIGTFVVKWGFVFDPLAVIMLALVSFISLLVHIYSIEYMAGDPHITRFFSYLSLFTFLCYF